MKLVITTDCFLPRWDGIARFLSLLLPELVPHMQVTVFAPKFPGKLPAFRGVKIIRFPLINVQFGDIFFCKPDKSVMEKAIREADVVFNHTIGPVGYAGITIAKKVSTPVISYIHSYDWELAKHAVKHWGMVVQWFVKLRARRLYNKCSLLMVPSFEIDDLLSRNKIKTQKALVNLGVSTSNFFPPVSKSAAKKKLGLAGKFVIGFCGRIAREKDLPTLYGAFKQIHKKHSAAVLLLVGEGLESEIPSSKAIVKAGRQDNAVPYLQAMDVFVMPSFHETSSLATMEAMSTGLPVIVTPVGNIREYVVHKKNGLFFARQDVEELASKIEYLLKRPKLRKSLGVAARKTIVKAYSWRQAADKIKKILLTFSG